MATLAHELRNPLAPLSNGLHLLENSGLNHVTIDKVHKMMTRQLSHLVRLVDDLMEVSRVTRGLVNLRKERIDLTEVLLNAIETSQPLIKNCKHQLETNISSQSLILEGDKVRLTQIVTNILNNAAKYTLEGGHIWLSAHRDGTEAIVSIRDNGLGIPAEAQTKIFDMFFQIKPSDDRAQGGLGIELTLVKSLIDMHGCSVEIHSEGVNQGAEFILRLPLVEEINNFKQPDQGESELGKLSSHHILIVDDNKDAADSLALLLGQLVAEVKTVNDGAASIELLKTFKPSVILLDIGMPGMDGYQVARWVRQQPLIQHIKLIAMTGWGQEEDRRKSFEAGIDHHLVKPVDFGTLMKLLQ